MHVLSVQRRLPRRDRPVTRDYGAEAQAAAETHLHACEDALAAEEAYLDGVSTVIPGSRSGGGPRWPETANHYCGCETCQVREILYAAWPILVEAVKAGRS